jgi:hypothetical protein
VREPEDDPNDFKSAIAMGTEDPSDPKSRAYKKKFSASAQQSPVRGHRNTHQLEGLKDKLGHLNNAD